MQSSTHFHDHRGQLSCEGVTMAEIATAVGTPVYVYSQAEIVRRAAAYQQAAMAALSHFLVCYAVKANSNPALLRLLAGAGLGADVTSGGELFLALNAGFEPQKILFSGVGKTRPEIEAALTAGIRALHIESPMELALVSEVAATYGRIAHIAIRVNPNVSANTHPHISTGRHTHKFGVTVDQAMAMLRQAAAHPWLKPAGLAAHIGSQISDLAPFVESAGVLCMAAAKLAGEGIQLDYLDVGGGLAIDYANVGVPEPAEWVAAVAKPVGEAGYELIMEPGRSIVGPAGALLTQVIYTKEQGEKTFVITDAGMTDLMRPALYDAYHPIVAVVGDAGEWGSRGARKQRSGGAGEQNRSGSRRQLEIVDVVGPVCETADYLGRERPLPPVKAGDLLAILQAGAYGFVMSSNYNGRLRPAELLVNGSQFQIIRRRQTYEHLLDGCD